jgi:hypothetical protein
MKNKPTQKRKVPNLKVRTIWIAGWLISAAALMIFFWPKPENELVNSSSQPQPIAPSITGNAGQEKLLGRWMRSDGGYVIEIRNVAPDGKLQATYFNPNPIQVGRAEWSQKNDNLVVVVELRDVNYPGSLYTLDFHAANDRLVGTYFQAVEGVNFDVEFIREQ